jgi:hypothetical protein
MLRNTVIQIFAIKNTEVALYILKQAVGSKLWSLALMEVSRAVPDVLTKNKISAPLKITPPIL